MLCALYNEQKGIKHKAVRQLQTTVVEERSTKWRTRIPLDCRCLERHGKTRKRSQICGDHEGPTTKGNVGPRAGRWTRESTSVESLMDLNEFRTWSRVVHQGQLLVLIYALWWAKMLTWGELGDECTGILSTIFATLPSLKLSQNLKNKNQPLRRTLTRPMLRTQRKTCTGLGQSPPSPRSGFPALTRASQGSQWLPEAQPGLTGAGNCKMTFYEITKKLTNQSQGELIEALSTTMTRNFLVSETICTIKNDWVPKKLLFIGIISISYLITRN